MKKRGQHYVWRHYLKPWSNNELIYSSINGNICNPNLKCVGKERDFYKLKELTANDIYHINLLLELTSPHLKELGKGWLKSFNSIFEFKKLYEHNGFDDPEINRLLDEAINNMEEELHFDIEVNSIKYMESILNEDIEFYKTSQGRMDFTNYICVQYLRTRNMQEALFAIEKDSPLKMNYKNISGVLRHILATNLTSSILVENKFNMVLLKNKSNLELITGDQPVINTYSVSSSNLEPIKDLEFYYPVSPKLAILITKKKEFIGSNKLIISESEVNKYNQFIVEKSHSQIYATSENILRKYAACCYD